MSQFTIWLSTKEMKAVREEAERLNSSASFVVRAAVREYLGLNAKVVTLITRNNDERPDAC